MNLKPCPFCGEEPESAKVGASFIIWCDRCNLRFSRRRKAPAIFDWNTRHYPPEIQKLLDEAKPRKPEATWYDKDIVFCPRCREAFSLEQVKSLRSEIDKSECPRCKQALDWEE